MFYPFMHVCLYASLYFVFFFFTETAPTEFYTLSLHDALPISARQAEERLSGVHDPFVREIVLTTAGHVEYFTGRFAQALERSEEHTSELQSHHDLVCRLLLEKKKTKQKTFLHMRQDSTQRYSR